MNNKEEFNALVWPAVRYALGRQTYVVHDICKTLIRCVAYIYPYQRLGMAKEIRESIDSGNAGAQIDIDEWYKALRALEGELE